MHRLTSWPRVLLLTCLALATCCCGSGGAPRVSGAPPPPDDGGGAACGEVTTFETGRTPSAELHVAPGGDDQTGDGSLGTPFATLGRALQDVQPGVAVRLHPGDYTGTLAITDVSGTAAAPVWIGGLPGAALPRVVGGTEGMHLTRVRYLVLHDVEVTGAGFNGVNCDDGGAYGDPDATRHVVFRGLQIHDIGTGGNNDGLKLSGLDDYAVLDCVFRQVSAGSGIDHVGCHGGVIARCLFEDMGSNSIQLKGGTRDVEVRSCEFRRGGARALNIGGSTGFTYFRPPLSPTEPNTEARDIRVVANLIGDSTTPFAFVGAVDCLVANNTIRGQFNWLFRILQETTSSGGFTFLETQGCRVANNIFEFQAASLSTYVNIGPNTRGDTYTVDHNLWYAPDDPARSQPTNLPVGESDGLYGLAPFPDAASAPRVTTNSPAVGAGTPVTAVEGDYDERCYADPPAIGAFEGP